MGILPGTPAIWGQPAITEYALPTAAAIPKAIAKGADGNLWIIETASNKIAKITTSGLVTEYAIPTANSQPAGITSGPDGSVWFTETSGNKIGKITPSGVITEYPLPTAFSQPTSITAGPGGNIWFIEATSIPGTGIGKITTSGAVTVYPFGPGLPFSQITAGPDGNVWFTGSQAGRITPSGAITTQPNGLSIPAQAITLGPDGNLWAVGSPGVWRVTPAGLATPYSVPVSPSAGITAGPDGNLWLNGSARKITRLTTGGTFTEYSTPDVSGSGGIAAGPDGNIWFTEPASNKVGKLGVSSVPVDELLTVSQNSLTFTAAARGTPLSAQMLTVSSASATPFTVTPVGPWLSVSPSGSVTGNQSITVNADASNSAVSQYGMAYYGYIWLASGNVTQTVRVTLNVMPPAGAGDVKAQPEGLNFAYTIGSPLPGAGDLVITHSPLGFMPVTISYAISSPAGGTWLTLTTAGDWPLPSGSGWTSGAFLKARVDPTGLSPGSYNASITVVPTDGPPVTVPVRLTVSGGGPSTVGPDIRISPAYLNFKYTTQTNLPIPQRILITGIDPLSGAIPLTISYTIASPIGVEWLTLTRGGSSIPNGGSATAPTGLDMQVDPTGLPTGVYSASVTVAPKGAEALTVPVTLTVNPNPADAPPAITSIVNAASFAGGAIAPGEIVTIGGSGLGPGSPLGLALDSSGTVATLLGGVRALFNGYPAPLIYVSKTQINCVVPYELDGAASVLVQVSYAGKSGTFASKTTAVAPAIFTLNGSGSGTAAAGHSTGGYNGPDNPALAGSVITLYLTGEGQTNPGGVTGKVTAVDMSPGGPLTPQPLAGAPAVTIGGQPATVTFYGEAPGMVAGVMQLNVQIPVGLRSGSQPLMVSLGGASSQNGVIVSVR